MGFSPDHRTIAVVSIGSNSVTFIDTATNAVKHTTYVGRSPHEAFFTPDGNEVWVTVRGENYVAVLDGSDVTRKRRASRCRTARACRSSRRTASTATSARPSIPRRSSSRSPTIRSSGEVQQASPFCPNIAATPDGTQVWFTLKDIGKTQVFDARPPFAVLKTLDTGPITNHVNFARNAQRHVRLRHGRRPERGAGVPHRRLLARSPPSRSASCRTGSGRRATARRVYVGLENDDALAAIDTLTNTVIATIPIGQAPQAARLRARTPCRRATALQGLQPLGVAGQAAHLCHGAGGPQDGTPGGQAPTSVSLFDQGLTPGAAGLGHRARAEAALCAGAVAKRRTAAAPLEPLAAFMTNPAGSAIVNAVGPIRQIVRGEADAPRRYLVIVPGTATRSGKPVQVQAP